MSFRTILTHVDDTEQSGIRTGAAIKLAMAHEAHLVGVYLVPAAQLSASLAAMLPADVVERRLNDLGAAQYEAEESFRTAATAAGLDRIEWRAPAGPPLEAAVAHARCADLAILGQREGPEFFFADELVTTVMLSSGRPMLVVPYIGPRPTLGDNVLIAWDGGREATRALADALPLLERARRVNIVAIDRDGVDPAESRPADTRLASWLKDHGVAGDIRRYSVPDGGIAEFLLSRAMDFGSDLLVMGGYGHTRMRELVLGGVTRTLLTAMTVPVLMSH